MDVRLGEGTAVMKIPTKVNLDEVRIDPAWALRVAPAIALRRLALPLCIIDDELVTAMADTGDNQTIAAIAQATGKKVRPVEAEAQQLRRALLKVYGDTRSTAPTGTAGRAQTADDPVMVVDNLLRAANLRQASDIHIDPDRRGLKVRLRVDGILEEFIRIPTEQQAMICNRIKVMCGMDIAERRAPQDGAFVWASSAGTEERRQFDVRVATLPVRFGERITLRLLEAGRERRTLEELGMSEKHKELFERILERPHGLVLLTGPTGSGKSTTLYAAIRHLLRRGQMNILTVEDPVEYEIDDVAQVEIESGDKVNFSKALRSLLRHDPDVIMIGEIRDDESLDTAIKASLTGHLVLSTLHTNEAVSSVTRLIDMGLAPHMIAATLRLSAAQRLVRRLCNICREPCEISEIEAAATGNRNLAGQTAYKPGGCLACAGRGFSGRTGLFEFMIPDAEISSMIAAGAREEDIAAAMRRQGFTSLAGDAASKMLAGVTTIQEVLKTIVM
jgi:type II secretory ATPase GspE/PulE/Tfp pilus assembly ATPase PilB-like protein